MTTARYHSGVEPTEYLFLNQVSSTKKTVKGCCDNDPLIPPHLRAVVQKIIDRRDDSCGRRALCHLHSLPSINWDWLKGFSVSPMLRRKNDDGRVSQSRQRLY